MRYRKTLLLPVLVAGCTLMHVPQAARGETAIPPLQVIHSREAAGAVAGTASSPYGHPDVETFVLRNASDKTVTAWKFSCVYGLNDGRQYIQGRGEDAYRVDWAPGRPMPLLPGGTLLTEMPYVAPVGGPYAVRTCGISAVVFEDGATWGAPTEVERILERRRGHLEEADNLLHAITRLVGDGRALTPALVSEYLEPALPNGRWGLYREQVARVRSEARNGDAAAALTDLTRELRADMERLEYRLPASAPVPERPTER